MKSITLRGLSLQFDAGQVTHGCEEDQSRQAVELINLALQRVPFGLGAQLIVPDVDLLPELVAALAGQLRDNLPALKSGATPVWSRIITERRATHASTPERAHPPAGYLGSGVYLAGDHTDSDYPATLEAAARSGVRAAHAVLERR